MAARNPFIIETKLFFFSSKIQDGDWEPIYIKKTMLFLCQEPIYIILYPFLLENSRWQPGTSLYKQNHAFSPLGTHFGWYPSDHLIIQLCSFVQPRQCYFQMPRPFLPRILSIHIHITTYINLNIYKSKHI